MSTSNRFSALFKEPFDNDFPSLGKDDSTLESEENISRSSAKKTPTKIMLGHRSYEDELHEKDAYYDNQRTGAYEILSDKEKLASSLIKSKMCSSVGKNEECQHGENCRFAHSLDELKTSNCLFEQRCRFVRMSNGKLVNNGEKVCFHKHPHETNETFMSRTGLDRYKCAPQSVEQKTQPRVVQSFCQQPHPPLTFWEQPPSQPTFWHPQTTVDQQPPPQPAFWHPQTTVDQQPPPQPAFWHPPPLPQPTVDQQFQTNKLPETLNDATTSEQILVIRVPKEIANQALEIAMKSGKTRVQIEIIN
jgi:hypothetical protein